MARLAHRNIATLYELASEDGRAYLVSELIEGETLRALGAPGSSATASSRRSAPTARRRSRTRTETASSTAT